MKKIRANQKGAVLLTVLCFTTVCMIVAATALRVAAFSNQKSHENLRSTQARVLAEDYLRGYLETFPFAVDEATGKILDEKDFSSLQEMAQGHTVDSPNEIYVSLKGTSGTINSEYKNGGDCVIKVYEAGGGVVLRSEVTYDGVTENASVFFEGKVPSPYKSKNAVETCNAYEHATEASNVRGDIYIEYDVESDPTRSTMPTFFHNSNGVWRCNMYTNTNWVIGRSDTASTTDIYIVDTWRDDNEKDKYAPTVTAKGDVVIESMKMSTYVGKITTDGKRINDGGDDYESKLNNKDGYINAYGTFALTGTGSGVQIGGAIYKDGQQGRDESQIDVYAKQAIIGKIPASAENFAGTLYSAQTAMEGYCGTAFTTNDQGTFLHGNMYVRKNTTTNLGGDMSVSAACTIDGDLYVEGNLYIFPGDKHQFLNVTGALYVGGKIIDSSGNDVTAQVSKGSGNAGFEHVSYGSFSNTCPQNYATDKRSKQPDINYAPGLYEYKTNENPTATAPSVYKNATPNILYQKNYCNLQTEYLNALDVALKNNATITGSTTESKYTGDLNSLVNGSGVTIDKSCYLTEDEINKESGKLTVKVTNKDVVVLLPARTDYVEQHNLQIRVDNSEMDHGMDGKKQYYCYFMFYDPTKSLTSLKTSNFYSTNDDSNFTYQFYARNHGNEELLICDASAAAFNSKEYNASSTNIMYLLPNGSTLNLAKTEYNLTVQGVIYGPKATLDRSEATQGTLVYGQIKVGTYKLRETTNNDTVKNCPLANPDPDNDQSILGYIGKLNSTNGAIKLQYYIKGKR